MNHLAEHNVVATFPDMESARKAVEALTRAGIENEDISLLGRQVEEERHDPDTRIRDLEAQGPEKLDWIDAEGHRVDDEQAEPTHG